MRISRSLPHETEFEMSVFFCDTDCELWYTTAKELGVKVLDRSGLILDIF